jgi:hypothetical protein
MTTFEAPVGYAKDIAIFVPTRYEALSSIKSITYVKAIQSKL